MMTYPCPECSKGIVKKTVRKNFATKIRGYPFAIPEAIIGVCNNCGREFFGASEVKRWTRLYDEVRPLRCKPLGFESITAIRQGLRLTMGGFALFLGCTRQAVHNWEQKDRRVPQSGMADLLLRLVEESSRRGSIDVISWLKGRAQGLGVEIEPICMREQQSDTTEEEASFAPPEAYERLFGPGHARDLPTLIM